MKKPFFNSVGSALKQRFSVVVCAALALAFVLGMQAPSQSQASISASGGTSFDEIDTGTSSHNVRISVAGPANQTYRVTYVSRSGPIDPFESTLNGGTKPPAIGGGQLSNADFQTGSQTVNVGTGGGGFGSVNVGIVVNGDQYDEGSSTIGDPEFDNEYFHVEIIGIANTVTTGPGNSISTTNNKLECIIIDNDAPPVLNVQTIPNIDPNIDSFVAEGNIGSLNTVFVRVLADHVSGKLVPFRYRTYTGTASANSDFTAADVVTTIPINANTENQSNFNPAVLIAIPILADTLDEADENIVVDIRDPGNTVYGSLATVSVTNFACLPFILDDDAPVISITDAAVTEGDDSSGTVIRANFQVKLSTTSLQTVSCSFTTADGTAVDTANIPAGSGLPADYSDTGGTLTFAPGETTKTISIPILGDTIAEGANVNTRLETFFVSLFGGSLGATFADSGHGTGIALCTISDDDPLPQLFFGPPNGGSTGDLTISETNLDGNSLPTTSTANFVVSMTAKSGIPVTFNYSTSDGTAIDGVADATSATNPIDYQNIPATTLTFTPGETTQVVSYIENDALGVPQFRSGIPVFGDNQDEVDETFFVNLSSVLGATILDGQAQCSIIDNDGPDVSVTGGTGAAVQNGVTGSEGNSGSTPFDFAVTLSGASVQTITVTLNTVNSTAVAGQDYTAITNQVLTFSPGEISKTITVNVTGDVADERDETFALNIISVTNAKDPSAVGNNGDPQAIGTILDDDATPSIAINDVTLAEGNAGQTNATFTVQLSASTFQNVSFNWATADGTATIGNTDYLARNNQQTIAPGSTTASIIVPVVGDNTLEADETFFVNLTNVVNADAGSPVSDLQGLGTITNDDQAAAGLTINPTSVSVNESGTTANFTVKLDRQPTADVTIRFSTSDTTEGLVSFGAGAPANFVDITFNNGNYNVAQTITVTGQDDALVDGDISFLIVSENASSTDPLYSGLNGTDVSVINVDDEVPGFKVTPSSVTTTESGAAATFTVRLNVPPTADVTIPLSSTNTAEGTVLPSSLTFTTVNFNTPQTVTVTGIDDLVRDGDQAYIIVLGLPTSTDARYSVLDPNDVNATNVDNETPGVVVTPSTGLQTIESGTTATFTVRLSSLPTADVVIPIRSSNTAEGTVSPASLTFTTTNFNAPQTVTVTGVDDSLDDGDIAFTIITDAANSTDGFYNGIDPSDVSVTNVDDENPAVLITPATLTTNENQGTTTFRVRLVARPTADVTVPITSSDLTEGTVLPTSLTFTPANFNVEQTVTLTVVDELIDDGDLVYTITAGPCATTDIAYNGLSQQLTVTNVDNDVSGITVTPTTGLTTTELGGTATFSVVLTSQPSQNVTIALTSSDTTEGTVSPASLVFTPGNFNTPRTVTVTGVDDAIDDANVAYSIVTAAAVSTDPTYSGLNASNVALTNTDNDTLGVTVTPVTGLVTSESGQTASFTIVLNSQPTANVTIPLTTSDNTEGKPAVSSVVFTTNNWNTPQTVTVLPVDDSITDGTIAYTIRTSAAVSGDVGYSGFNAADVACTNLDNNTVGIIVTPVSGLTTTEAGGTATFTIRLNSQPTADVTIALSSSDTTEGTISSTSVTFTAATPPPASPVNTVKWNSLFTVTVTGVNDSLEDTHITYKAVTGAAVSADPLYSGLNGKDPVIKNIDNDDLKAPLVVITSPLDGSAFRTITQTTGTVSDPGNTATKFVSGVKSVQVHLRRLDNPATTVNDTGFFNPTSGLFETTFNLPNQLITATVNTGNGTWTANLPASGNPSSLPAGTYRVIAYATDNVNNTRNTSANTFTVDAIIPTVVISTPTEGASVASLAQASGTAADNTGGSGIGKVEVAIFRNANTANGVAAAFMAADGSFTSTTEIRLLATGTTSWSFILPVVPAGSYFVRAYATDVAGNVSAVATKNFTITGSGGDEFVGNVTYFISVPFMNGTAITSTTTATQAFTVPPVDPTTGQTNFLLQRYNARTLTYETLSNSSIMMRGEGYLLRPAARGTSLKRPASDTTRKPLVSTIQQFQVTLRNNPSLASNAATNGYNLIGDPFDPAIFGSADWLGANVTATIGGQSFNGTVAEAASRNILDASLYTFNSTTGQFDQFNGNLLPLKGVFVRTFVDGVQVNLKAVQ